MTPEEYNVVSHFIADGRMAYITSDFSLDGDIWKVRLYKRSTYSLSPAGDGVYIFDIEFRD